MHNEGIAGGKKFDSSRRDTTIYAFSEDKLWVFFLIYY